MDLLADGIAFGALVVSGLAFFGSNRFANRSADAAERSAIAAEEAVDRTPWTLTRVQGSKEQKFDLINRTGAVAEDVTATSLSPRLRLFRHPQGARVDPGAVWCFVAEIYLGGPERRLRIEWINKDGVREAWESVL